MNLASQVRDRESLIPANNSDATKSIIHHSYANPFPLDVPRKPTQFTLRCHIWGNFNKNTSQIVTTDKKKKGLQKMRDCNNANPIRDSRSYSWRKNLWYRVIKKSLCTWWLQYRKLTFRNRASYIQDRHTATLQTPHFSTNTHTEFFKHAPHSPFFFS
jgi:hypothetical protein